VAAPPLIGLTGAVGVGKSSALAAFGSRGCAVLSADTVVHGLYHRARVRDRVVERFGADVLDAAGEVDRVALASRVFADPEALEWLEGLVHPLVQEEMASWLRQSAELEPPPALVVYESPLLLEAGLADRFDRVLLVTADDAVRRERLARRGALERLAEREARMWSEARRRAAADDVIDNSGDPQALVDAVDAYIERYAGRPWGG
jgi:dephospho-CoA kinase